MNLYKFDCAVGINSQNSTFALDMGHGKFAKIDTGVAWSAESGWYECWRSTVYNGVPPVGVLVGEFSCMNAALNQLNQDDDLLVVQ